MYWLFIFLAIVTFVIYQWEDRCWGICPTHHKRCRLPRGHLEPHFHTGELSDHEWRLR